MQTSTFETDLELTIFQMYLWDLIATEHAEAMADAAKLPVSYVREILRERDRVEVKLPLGLTSESSPIPSFPAEFIVIGRYENALSGWVTSKSELAQSISRRYEDGAGIEDHAILSMADSEHFENVALLYAFGGNVALAVGSQEGEIVDFESNLQALYLSI